MQPEFHRAHRNAQCLRSFSHRQPVQIVQHDRQAQRIGQIVQHQAEVRIPLRRGDFRHVVSGHNGLALPADVLAHVDADAHRPCAEIFLFAQRRLLLPRPQRRLLHRIPAVILLAQQGAGHMVECSLNRAHLFDPCRFVHSVPFSPDKFSVKPASPSGTMRKLVKSAHGAKYRQMDG